MQFFLSGYRADGVHETKRFQATLFVAYTTTIRNTLLSKTAYSPLLSFVKPPPREIYVLGWQPTGWLLMNKRLFYECQKEMISHEDTTIYRRIAKHSLGEFSRPGQPLTLALAQNELSECLLTSTELVEAGDAEKTQYKRLG